MARTPAARRPCAAAWLLLHAAATGAAAAPARPPTAAGEVGDGLESGEWATFLEPWCRCPDLAAVEQTLVVEEWPKEEYQRFIDYFPVTRYRRDVFHYQKFGASQAAGVPQLMAAADWFLAGCPAPAQAACPSALGGVVDVYRREDPDLVFVHASRWNQLLFACERYLRPGGKRGRVLVVAGSDQKLSWHKDKLVAFRPFFDTILFEAKDVFVEGVGTMPMGLAEHYLRGDVLGAAQTAIQNACLELAGSCKSRRVLVPAALSVHWGEYGVPKDRRLALEWAKGRDGRAAGAEARGLPPQDWWTELSRYQFLVSPSGNGVQTSKTLEALLTLTIPIVTRSPAHKDLVRYGFPIVVVRSWNEITPENLDRWWKDLSPRLVSFRQNCLTTQGFLRIVTSGFAYCE